MFSIRPATHEDIPVLAAHRRAMFFDMGHRDEALLDSMTAAFIPWVRAKMTSAEYFAWLAVDADSEIAAGAGLWLMDWPPHMIGPGSNRRGNILNVYTRAEYRRKGLARKLTETAVEWCREHGISTVILHASEQGRDLYTSMGFQPTNEMRRVL